MAGARDEIAAGRAAPAGAATCSGVWLRLSRPTGGAGRADRVTDRDATAVDVHAVEIARLEAPFASDGKDLGGEGFVQFDEVHVLDPEREPIQHLLGRGDGADAHIGRVDAGDRPGAE